MLRFAILSGAIVMVLGSFISAQESDALKSAADALGVNHTKSLQFIASGATFTVGQNFTPSDPWPRVTLKRYAAVINYETGNMQQELLREMGATMPRAGGVPFTGELHQIQAMSGQTRVGRSHSRRSESWRFAGWPMHTSRGRRHVAGARTRSGQSGWVHANAGLRRKDS